MFDLFDSYPQISLLVSYLKEITTLKFQGIACFNSLKQLKLGYSSTFDSGNSLKFAQSCPSKLVNLRLSISLVVLLD